MPDCTRRVEALFAEALDLERDARDQLLARAEREDSTTVREVRQLLGSLDSRPDFLTSPPSAGLAVTDSTPGQRDGGDALPTLSLPRRIGRYELVRRIGAGGMGTVFEATQDLPRRRVAVKLLRVSPAAGSSGLERFEREADVLARLQHPAIAQIYEAGVEQIDDRSLPYLAMELIPDARMITTDAWEKKLSIEKKLRLFLIVCDGVEHAHQKGVIHRDLKPANVLMGSDGRPKVIDFGVARLLDDGSPPPGPVTVEGTVWFMSPEQIWASGAGLDTRSDVYSLGILLYTLLCRAFPFDVKARDLRRAIRTITESPRIEARARIPEIDADLNAIVSRAIEIDPETRYASVGALAADIHRYLRSEPVSAQPARLPHSLRLLFRRRRALVITVGALVVLLFGALTGITLQYLKLRTTVGELEATRWSEAEQRQRATAARSELSRMRRDLGSFRMSENDRRHRRRWILGDTFQVGAASPPTSPSNPDRERMITGVMGTLKQLERLGGDDPQMRTVVAQTYLELGDLRGAPWDAPAGLVRSAVPAYKEAVRILSELWARDPSDAAVGELLVGARLRWSHSLRRLGEGGAARRAATAALELAEHICATHPRGRETGLLWVSALWARSDSALLLADANVGLRDSVRSVELAEELVRGAPRDAEVLEALAWSHHRVGSWLKSHFDDVGETRAHMEAASDARMLLCRLRPDRLGAIEALLEETTEEIQLLLEREGPGGAARRQRMILDTAREAMVAGHHEDRAIEVFAAAARRLARLFTRAGDKEAAFAVCRDLSRRLEQLRRQRNDESLHVQLVETLIVQSEAGRSVDPAGADADLDRALGLVPRDDPAVVEILAEALERAGRGEDGQALFHRVRRGDKR